MTRNVLLVSDNGHGLGHLTRLLAVGRRLDPSLRPVFLTLSTAHRVATRMGYVVEHFPSRTGMRLVKSHWNVLFTERLLDAVERFDPAAVVIDHVAPAQAFEVLAARRPDVPLVWCRRPMWREGKNEGWEPIRGWFDEVLEPGDLGAPFDRGATASDRVGVTRVPPVTLLGAAELEDRDEARRSLGLPAEGAAVLIGVSADTPEEFTGLVRRCLEAARRVAPSVTAFAPRHALHRDAVGRIDGLHMREVYPLSRHLKAFDVGVIGAGYNTVHELAVAQVPAVYLPRDTDSVDDQLGRARGAELAGAGVLADRSEGLEAAIAGQLAATDAGPPPVIEDGGAAAARWLSDLADNGAPVRAPAHLPAATVASEVVLPKIRSGWHTTPRDVPIVVVDARSWSSDTIATWTSELVERQQAGRTSKPVVVLGDDQDAAPLVAEDIAYETVLSPATLRASLPEVEAEPYQQRRVEEVARTFAAAEIVEQPPRGGLSRLVRRWRRGTTSP